MKTRRASTKGLRGSKHSHPHQNQHYLAQNLKNTRQSGYDPTWQGLEAAVATMAELPIDSWRQVQARRSTGFVKSTALTAWAQQNNNKKTKHTPPVYIKTSHAIGQLSRSGHESYVGRLKLSPLRNGGPSSLFHHPQRTQRNGSSER